MAATGVDLSQYGPSSEECLEPEEGTHENQEEEQVESEDEEVDDPCS